MENLQQLVAESRSLTELSRKLGYTFLNGRVQKKVEKMLREKGIDFSHFKKGGHTFKYRRITKSCPICGKQFEVLKGHKREKTTCSYACSNTFFRSGIDHPNWVGGSDHIAGGKPLYIKICFFHHKKECVICKEQNVVAVHHFDGSKENNAPENLIPLCPTHHTYWHSRFRSLVEETIVQYRNGFIDSAR